MNGVLALEIIKEIIFAMQLNPHEFLMVKISFENPGSHSARFRFRFQIRFREIAIGFFPVLVETPGVHDGSQNQNLRHNEFGGCDGSR
jgi:hypothetical protein